MSNGPDGDTTDRDNPRNRFRSTRGYRRALDKVIHEALEGKRPMEDVQKMAAACKAGSELIMAENLLKRAGGDREDQDHPYGETGGTELPRGSKTYRRKKVVVKAGVNKHGARVDERAVTIDTSADDDDAETDADVDTL